MLSGKSYQMMHNVIKKIKPNDALCYQRVEPETNLSRDDFLLKRSLGCLDIILKTPLFNPAFRSSPKIDVSKLYNTIHH